MKSSSIKKQSSAATRTRQQGQVRISFVVVFVLLAALGGLAVHYYRSARAPEAVAADTTGALSSSAETVLTGLKSPIEIRFYSLLDPASTPEALRAYAGRVSRLLDEYERAGNGNIHVVRFDTLTDANANAAAADGIHSFNRDKGEASYLGITAARDGQKESMAEISPEWETALESDLSRLIARVNGMTPPGATPANVSDASLKTAQAAIDSNPSLASASLAEGTDILRNAALAEFKATVADMQSRSQAEEQRLGEGAVSQTDAAMELQKIRAEQTAKLQEITSRLHDQLAALAQSKGAAH